MTNNPQAPMTVDEQIDELVSKFDDDFADYHNGHWDYSGLTPTGKAKQAIKKLLLETRKQELVSLRDIEGGTVDAWASPAYQQILDRIDQLTKEADSL